MKKILLITLVVTVLLTSQRCTFPEVKEARFQRDHKEVVEELKSLKNFEDAGIKWSATSFKDKTTQILIVELLNGKDLRKDKEHLQELGKKALKIVISSIENENDYDKFRVMFIQKADTGTASATSSIFVQFSLDELM